MTAPRCPGSRRSVLAWHFLSEDRLLRYGHGDLGPVEPGYIYSAEGPLELCRNGMHASVRPLDALQYAPSPIVCRVRLMPGAHHPTCDKRNYDGTLSQRACNCNGDPIVDGGDKLCARHREVLWMQDARTILRLFAVWCARDMPISGGRRAWDLLIDKRSKNAVLIAERHAHGQATDKELAAARAAAWAAAWAAALDAANDHLTKLLRSLAPKRRAA
jgi:hypothetical protein